MKYLPLLISIVLISCKSKQCVKYQPYFQKDYVYEFNYDGQKIIHITDEYGVRKENWGRTYQVHGTKGCCDVVAEYPTSKTTYHILKDTSIVAFHQCVEWK